MSLLKNLLAATLLADPADALAAVKDALATQVLTTEDLSSADVYDLSEAIRSKGNAVCLFTRDDLDGRFDGTPTEAETWLDNNSRRIGDRLAETGNQVIDDLLMGDGLYKSDTDDEDEDEDGIDEVEALIYGAAGHPSRSKKPSDFMWTLRVDNERDREFDAYREAFEAANSGRGVPFRLIPPLAERDHIKLIVFSGGVGLGGPGQGFFYAPVEQEDGASLDGDQTDLPIFGPFKSVEIATAAAINDNPQLVITFAHEDEDMPDWMPAGY